MILGNAVLYLSAVFIVIHHGSFSPADVVFGAVVASCVGLRYLDIKYLKGETASGEPATLAHWRRYSLLLGAFALALWGVAHVIGYLFG
jgi:multisubunit Na+/H+ antiporter MnhE subunit